MADTSQWTEQDWDAWDQRYQRGKYAAKTDAAAPSPAPDGMPVMPSPSGPNPTPGDQNILNLGGPNVTDRVDAPGGSVDFNEDTGLYRSTGTGQPPPPPDRTMPITDMGPRISAQGPGLVGFEELGYGNLVKFADGRVLPKDHPDAIKLMSGGGAQPQIGGEQVSTTLPASPITVTPNTPSLPPGGGDMIAQQAKNASTYSQTPGAAPTPQTTNQGTQDVVRNTLLKQATQPLATADDAAIKKRTGRFAATAERARRDSVDEAAAALGPDATGALDAEKRLAAERSGREVASFEDELVTRELTQQRDEIRSALNSLGATVDADQRRALEEKLTQAELALREKSINQSGSLGDREIGVRERLGQGDLSLRAMLGLLQNKQFGQDLGFRVGATEADYNDRAMRVLLGG